MVDTTFRTVLPDLKAVDNGDGTYSVATVITNMTYNPFTIVRTGDYYHNFLLGGGLSAVLALTPNRLYHIPATIPRDMTIDRIGIDITIAGGGGSVARLGIYNDGTNVTPGTLLLDAGTVAADGVVMVAATVAQALTEGLYWFCVVSDSNPTLRVTYGYGPQSPLGYRSPTSFDSGTNMWYTNAIGIGALAATAAAPTASDYRALSVGKRVSSLD